MSVLAAEIPLEPDEKQLFDKSVASVQTLVEACKTINPTFAKQQDFANRF